jgi:hypothetical protein
MGCTLPVKASTSCSSVQCNRSSPSSANLLGSVSPCAKACRMRSPLAPSKLLTTTDSLMRISSSRHSIWFCSRTRSRVSCTFMRVRLRQIRCSTITMVMLRCFFGQLHRVGGEHDPTYREGEAFNHSFSICSTSFLVISINDLISDSPMSCSDPSSLFPLR